MFGIGKTAQRSSYVSVLLPLLFIVAVGGYGALDDSGARARIQEDNVSSDLSAWYSAQAAAHEKGDL